MHALVLCAVCSIDSNLQHESKAQLGTFAAIVLNRLDWYSTKDHMAGGRSGYELFYTPQFSRFAPMPTPFQGAHPYLFGQHSCHVLLLQASGTQLNDRDMHCWQTAASM